MHGYAYLWLLFWAAVWVALGCAVATVLGPVFRGTIYDRRYARHAYPDPKARERQVTAGDVIGSMVRAAELDYRRRGMHGRAEVIVADFGAQESGPGWEPPRGGWPGAPPSPGPGAPGGSEVCGPTAPPAPSPGQRQALWTGREVPPPDWDDQALKELHDAPTSLDHIPAIQPSRLLEDTGSVELAALTALVTVQIDRQDRDAADYIARMREDAAAFRLAMIGDMP